MNSRGVLPTVLLASGSPRRADLLARLDIDFRVVSTAEVDETYSDEIPAQSVAAHLSERKSRAYTEPIAHHEVLLTCDTVVILGDRVLGKPTDREQAVEMLRSLSGKTHRVMTAMTLRGHSTERTISVSTEVTFTELSLHQIEYYVDNFSPYDKAGAYGAQEWIGLVGILEYKGSYSNVVGLPTTHLIQELCFFGH